MVYTGSIQPSREERYNLFPTDLVKLVAATPPLRFRPTVVISPRQRLVHDLERQGELATDDVAVARGSLQKVNPL